MTSKEKINCILNLSWVSYTNKVAAGVLDPENEKMMQLQLSLIILSLLPLFEFHKEESLKLLLEVPVKIRNGSSIRNIDIVLLHTDKETVINYPIELKCFRKNVRGEQNKSSGAGNNKMFNYWMDIENIEQYALLENFGFGTQLTLTDDEYFVNGKQKGKQVSVFSTAKKITGVTGNLQSGTKTITLLGQYSMGVWETIKKFHFIMQKNNNLP